MTHPSLSTANFYKELKHNGFVLNYNVRKSEETRTDFLTYPDISQQEIHIYISALQKLCKLKYKKRYCLW